MSSVKENVGKEVDKVKVRDREITKIVLLILVFLGFSLGDLFAQPFLETGKVVVKFNPDVVPVFETRLRTLNKTSSDTSLLITGVQSFDRINRRYRATSMRRVFPDAGEYEAKHRRYGLHLWYEIVIPKGEDPEKVADGYSIDENIQIAEPRYKIRSMAMPASPLPFGEMPSDPNFYRQWNYNNTGQTGGTPGADIRLADAWDKVKSLGIKNKNVIVAVMDGGVYYEHEDLKANMWKNYGYNFVNSSSKIVPEDHATHVAGIIGAVTDNGIGVSGIAGNPAEGYGIQIMTVQILEGNDDVEFIGPAFTYAADNGAVISQNSWGYGKANDYNEADIEAINYFINEAGKDQHGNPREGTPMVGGIVIFAAGNDKKDDKWYPAYFDNVLAVAATNHYGKLAWYSNFGNWVDISAPGGDTDERGKNSTGGIYSTSYRTNNKNYYEYKQGTSMACPHVSGVAALILSVYGNENYTPDMLRSRLLCSATPLAGFDPVNASKMGAGLVNASTALAFTGISDGVITDLTAQTINAVSCRLSWKIPDDELGFYTIAYATENINEANFDKYARTLVSTSQEADVTRQITINGLSPETTYYVAIRNFDNCYRTVISNAATFTTTQNQAPVIISGLVTDTTLIPLTASVVINLTKYIFDPEDEQITFDVITDGDGIVDATINNGILSIFPRYHGEATLRITATDPHAAQAITTIHITVEQKYAPDNTNQLLLYPNPTNDILWYSYILNERASVYIRIVNSSGQLMFQAPVQKHTAGIYYNNINLTEWATGMYVVQLIVDEKIIDTQKMVKIK